MVGFCKILNWLLQGYSNLGGFHSLGTTWNVASLLHFGLGFRGTGWFTWHSESEQVLGTLKPDPPLPLPDATPETAVVGLTCSSSVIYRVELSNWYSEARKLGHR